MAKIKHRECCKFHKIRKTLAWWLAPPCTTDSIVLGATLATARELKHAQTLGDTSREDQLKARLRDLGAEVLQQEDLK